MNQQTWTFTSASVIGTSHIAADTSCQDKSECCVIESAAGTVLVAVVSDGAGSAARSEEGAALACSIFVREMHDLFNGGGGVRDITREFAERWLIHFQNEVGHRAEAEQTNSREFACTFLASVIGEDCAVFFQVGDGAIVVPSEESVEYCWVFWPQQGDYENITNFATEATAQQAMEHALVNHRVDELVMFSDGLQRLVLDFRNRTAPSPFFQKMLAPLRLADPGYSEILATHLVNFLNSQQVTDRTEDDKTLVLASRRERVDSSVGSTREHQQKSQSI
jgi:protein phosphatase 2C-like protein